MSRANKTICQQLEYRPEVAGWLEATQVLFNRIAAFYFEVISAHPETLELDEQAAISALERLTHATKTNPNPVMPLVAIADQVPALFRRAAIRAALGAAHSFHSNLARWHKEKERILARGKLFKKRPPAPPGNWNIAVTFYAGMWKQRTAKGILIKLWTGKSWCWVKFGVSGPELPEDWEAKSPQIVQRGKRWRLHTHVEKDVPSSGNVEKQVTSNPATRICAVNLNVKNTLAVCTVQTREGTVLATLFIRGGRKLHGLRKSLLGGITRRWTETGLVAHEESNNAHLWAKVRNLDEQEAQRVSRRIVDFARDHGATVLVFEHLAKFQLRKGKYSQRSNERRGYWLRGKILRYSQYKAWAEGILTSRVSQRHNNRECARCHALIARYSEGQAASGYTPGASLVFCSECGMRGSAERNASLNIGQKLFVRYGKQEKPQTSSQERRLSKERGVPFPQAAENGGRPHTEPVRHGEGDGHGTAQDQKRGVVRAGQVFLAQYGPVK
jgi:putative transposase